MSKESNPPVPTLVDDEMWTLEEVCVYFGGKSKPLHPATLYRGIKPRNGKPPRYPAPISIGPQISRRLKSEAVEARRKLIAESQAKREATSLRMRAAGKKSAEAKAARRKPPS